MAHKNSSKNDKTIIERAAQLITRVFISNAMCAIKKRNRWFMYMFCLWLNVNSETKKEKQERLKVLVHSSSKAQEKVDEYPRYMQMKKIFLLVNVFPLLIDFSFWWSNFTPIMELFAGLLIFYGYFYISILVFHIAIRSCFNQFYIPASSLCKFKSMQVCVHLYFLGLSYPLYNRKISII